MNCPLLHHESQKVEEERVSAGYKKEIEEKEERGSKG
jgi:hypothetical protein